MKYENNTAPIFAIEDGILGCNRKMITIGEFFENDDFSDLTIYKYNCEAAEYNLDPWSIVEPDKAIDGGYFVNWNSTKTVSEDFPLYISR